jgi:hypothetical protein
LAELTELEKRFGPGAWQRREDGLGKTFEDLADLGQTFFDSGGYPGGPKTPKFRQNST